MCFPVPSSFLCEEHPKTSVSSVKRRLANGGIYGSCDGGGSGSGSVWICLAMCKLCPAKDWKPWCPVAGWMYTCCKRAGTFPALWISLDWELHSVAPTTSNVAKMWVRSQRIRTRCHRLPRSTPRHHSGSFGCRTRHLLQSSSTAWTPPAKVDTSMWDTRWDAKWGKSGSPTWCNLVRVKSF